MALVAVITHAKGGLQTKPLKLRIDLINTCAQCQWLGLSPVLSQDVSATRAKLCPNSPIHRLRWIDRPFYHGCNRPNHITSPSNHRPAPIEQCGVANGRWEWLVLVLWEQWWMRASMQCPRGRWFWHQNMAPHLWLHHPAHQMIAAHPLGPEVIGEWQLSC
jgi:hypothetical protein